MKNPNKKAVKTLVFFLVLTLVLQIMPVLGVSAVPLIDPPASGAVAITNAAELAGMQNGGTYYLANDIDLSGYNGGIWAPLTVRVTLDGQGHKITNLNIPTYANRRYAGLFGNVQGYVNLLNLEVSGQVNAFNNNETVFAGMLVAAQSITVGTVTITNCKASGSVYAYSNTDAYAGGIIGQNGGSISITNSNASGSAQATSLNAAAYAGGIIANSVGTGTFTNNQVNSTVMAFGANNTYAGGVGGFLWSVDNLNLDGNTGLVYATTNASRLSGFAGGLAAYCYAQNISVANVDIQGEIFSNSVNVTAYAAGLISNIFDESKIHISNSSTSTLVSAIAYDKAYAGGFLGYGNNSQVLIDGSNTQSEGNISASGESLAYAGGVIGYNKAATGFGTDVGFASSSADVLSEAPEAYAGGIAGALEGNVNFMSNVSNGSVYGQIYAGGILGYANGGEVLISTCASGGKVDSINMQGAVAGGIVGYASGTGFAGLSSSQTTGNVNGGTMAGGLIGYADTAAYISNCYVAGQVKTSVADAVSGGLVGENESTLSITSSYSAGYVNSGQRGGLVGRIIGALSINSSFYDNQTTGCKYTLGNNWTLFASSGVPQSQMQNQATFTGWDFVDTWQIDPTRNNGYPYLKAYLPSFTEAINVLLGTNKIVEGYAANIPVSVDPAYNGAFVTIPGTSVGAIVVNGKALLQLAKPVNAAAPAPGETPLAGTYSVKVSLGSIAVGSATLTVEPKNATLWAPTVISTPTNVKVFFASMISGNITASNSAPVVINSDNTSVTVTFDASTPGTFTLSNVKYPDIFPNMKFTFAINY